MGLGKILGTLSEFVSKLMGKEPGFTKDRIYYVTAHRWFNIEKARRVLGYEPDVGVEEGIKRAVAVYHFFGSRVDVADIRYLQWWKEEEATKKL